MNGLFEKNGDFGSPTHRPQAAFVNHAVMALAVFCKTGRNNKHSYRSSLKSIKKYHRNQQSEISFFLTRSTYLVKP
jgi:hypothetical protein